MTKCSPVERSSITQRWCHVLCLNQAWHVMQGVSHTCNLSKYIFVWDNHLHVIHFVLWTQVPEKCSPVLLALSQPCGCPVASIWPLCRVMLSSLAWGISFAHIQREKQTCVKVWWHIYVGGKNDSHTLRNTMIATLIPQEKYMCMFQVNPMDVAFVVAKHDPHATLNMWFVCTQVVV